MRFPRSLAAGFALVLASHGAMTAQDTKAKAADIAVTVTYKGAGTVDRDHEIWVFLFESPDFGRGGATPLTVMALRKNGDTATFKGVQANPVYVAVAFDEGGSYDGIGGPPPPGSPIGMYRTKESTTASPVKPGDSVKLTFDDTTRM